MAHTPLKRFSTSLSSWLKAAKRTRVSRAGARYTEARGPILAAGISYKALFSLTAILTVAWTIFSSIMSNPQVRAAVIEAANTALPGLFRTDATPEGLVDPQSLVATGTTSLAGVVALLVALYSATGVVTYLSRSIRSMFGLEAVRVPLPRMMIQRVVGLTALVLGVMSAAALASLNTFLHQSVADWLGTSHSWWVSPVFAVGTALIPFAVDFCVFIVMVRWVASVSPPRRDLLGGATLAALGSTGLRLMSTFAVSQVSGPVLTAATSLITLALWVNLLAMTFLLASAWTANPPLTEAGEATTADK